MGPEVAVAAAIGSLALDAGSSVVKGIGEKEGQDFMAWQAERAAALGRIKADQTDAHLRDELQTTLGNIDVIRAAANTDPLSPTALAVKDKEREVSDRQRQIQVANIRTQADEKEAEAGYRRRSGKFALFGGIASGVSKIGKAVAMGG